MRIGITVCYVLIMIFMLGIIGYVSNYLYASTVDAHYYSFNETWYTNAKLNFDYLNGRWAQGFTNDHRFYIYRVTTTLFLNLFFFGSIWYFFKGLLKKWHFVMATIFYLAFVLNSINFYQIAYLLNTSLSYTFGEGLLFCFYGYALRKGFPYHFKNPHTWLLGLLIVFLTGLVEHLFLLNIAILAFLLLFKWLEQKKWDKGILLFFILNVAGSVVTLLSPGLRLRREQTALRNERLGKDASIDFNAFFDTLGEQLVLNLTWVSLAVFIFSCFLFLNSSNFRFRRVKLKGLNGLLFLVCILLLPITPLLLGYVGSNGLVGMPKAYNLFALLVLISVLLLAYFMAFFLKASPKKKTIWVAPITGVLALLVFMGILYSFFYDTKSKLYFQYRQVKSGDIQKPYFDELARRQYLMETYHHYEEKTIPALSKAYQGKVDGAHRQFIPRYYYKRFNNSIPIHSSESLPTPRSFTTTFLIKNHKLRPVAEHEGVQVYYNATLKVLAFQTKDAISEKEKLKDLRVTIHGKHFLQNKSETMVFSAATKMKQSPAFYQKYPNIICFELPLYTQALEVEALNLTIDEQDLKVKDIIFFQPDYGNIMR